MKLASKPEPLALALLLLAGALGAPAARAGQMQDEIVFYEDENRLLVTIIAEDYDTVTYLAEGQEQTADQQSVLDVRYRDEPPAYRQGRELLDQGRYAEARDQLRRAQAETTVRPWLKQYAGYFEGLCLLELARAGGQAADFQAAFERLDRLNQDYPRNKYRLEAQLAGLEALLGAQELDRARTFAAGVAGGFEQDSRAGWRNYAAGRVAEARGEAAAAAAAYGEAAQWAQAEDVARWDLAALARARRGLCLLAAGDRTGARQQLIALDEELRGEESLPPLCRAVAANALGDLELAEERFEEALLSFLRVELLFPQDGQERAHALLQAARCLVRLDRVPTARRLLDRVIDTFPNGPWAREAQAEKRRLP